MGPGGGRRLGRRPHNPGLDEPSCCATGWLDVEDGHGPSPGSTLEVMNAKGPALVEPAAASRCNTGVRRALGLALLAVATGCSGSDERQPVTVAMEEQSGSTQFGDAVLTDVGESRTRIDLSVGNAGRTQYARLFRGSCDDLGAGPVYALADVVEGESTTELDVPLDDLVGGGYAIAVHQLPDTLRLAVCGELPAAKRSKTRSRPPSRRS